MIIAQAEEIDATGFPQHYGRTLTVLGAWSRFLETLSQGES